METKVSEDDDPLWRLRWLLLASGVATLLSIAVLHVLVQHSWRWAPFVWSVAICCPAGAADS